MWKYAEREPELIYSQPYLWNRLILVGRHGSDVSATSLADLAGKRIALVAGYVYGEEVETTGGLTIVGLDRRRGQRRKTPQWRGGLHAYGRRGRSSTSSRNYGEEARTRLAFGSTPLLTRSLHLAVRRSLADAESVISRFNAELRGMIADRTYHRLFHLDWIQADVDGDGRSEYVPDVDQTGPRPPERSYIALGDGQSDHERHHRAFLLRRHHLRRLVKRSRAVQVPGPRQTRAARVHGQDSSPSSGSGSGSAALVRGDTVEDPGVALFARGETIKLRR